MGHSDQWYIEVIVSDFDDPKSIQKNQIIYN